MTGRFKFLVIGVLPAAVCIVAVWIAASLPGIQRWLEPDFTALRIAHAGGGIAGQSYTNSYEAMDESVALGFRYIELDLMFTRDGKLVCLHDWDRSFLMNFGRPAGQVLTLEEFEALFDSSPRYRNCTLDGLVVWLEKNPAVWIVTDVKGGDNLTALTQISQKVANFPDRIIPQIYTPENYAMALAIGYQQIIWTLYRYRGSEEETLRWARRLNESDGALAITMPKRLAVTELPRQLAGLEIPTYVHTINAPQEASQFQQRGVTEIYTDFLAPEAK